MPVGIGKCPPGAMSAASTGNDWLTPPDLLIALGALKRTAEGEYVLGRDPFSLDPTTSVRQPWPTARTMWTEYEDGSARDWADHGKVYLNAPYGTHLYSWLARLADHGNGVALLYARTDTVGFHAHVWARADALFFFAGRPWFHVPVTGEQAPANCGGPMCCAAYGAKSVARLAKLTRKNSAYPGVLVPIVRGKSKAA